MHIKKYTLIEKPLTRAEFKHTVSQVKGFKDANNNIYEVRGIIVNAIELHAIGLKGHPNRFVNLHKLYRNYCRIAGNTEVVRPKLHERDLGFDLLISAGMVGIQNNRP